jgi:hypothetical protein
MMSKRPKPQGEKPRSEPEIIPPEHAGQGTPRMRVFVDTHGTERVYIAKPGPLGIIIIILVTGILSAVLFVLLSAVLLIAMPVVVLLVAAVIIAGLVRAYFWPAS